MRYNYSQEDIADLIEKSILEKKPCIAVFKDGQWPFSENVLNGFLVGRRTVTSARLKTAIAVYRKSKFRFANYPRIADDALEKIIKMRKAGSSLSEISTETGLKIGTIQWYLSGKALRGIKVNSTAKRGRKPKEKTEKPIKIRTEFCTVTRASTIRIEIVQPANFAAALYSYWAERDFQSTGEADFLQHLALMAEHGFIPDSVQRFGVIARIEKDTVKVRLK